MEASEVNSFYDDILERVDSDTARRPVIFLPGYVTSGLELWKSKPCARAKFRERIWGTASMVKLFLTNSQCWIDHMRLVPKYGRVTKSGQTVHFTEPEGVRIQPASGLAAADFVLGDYWVWNPIIEALASAGYDESMMFMMSYDWRLPLRDLEYKDKYYSRMALEIEKLERLNGEKVLMVSHSFGGKVWFFFIQWASEHLGPKWIDDHIYATYNIAPVFLGVPKAIAATLSGDTRDTAQLGALSTLLDTLLPPSDRSTLFSGWGSLVDMLPLGGASTWKSPMLILDKTPMNVDEALKTLFNTSAMAHHAHHRNGDRTALRCPPDREHSTACYRDVWVDPTSVQLPPMTKSKIWCSYGVGIPTEVGYHYTAVNGNWTDNHNMKIEKDMHNEANKIVNGIVLDDGDGTVPIESLASICSIAWKGGSRLNAKTVSVNVRELAHGENYSVLSRAISPGGSSVDHVDIMGNRQVIRDILFLALGLDDLMDPPTDVPVVLLRNITLG
jgi:phospholipid:diacylglycerol acyltransferase